MRRGWVLALIAIVALAGAVGSYIYTQFRSDPKLTDRDTIVRAPGTRQFGVESAQGSLRCSG